MVIPFFQLFKRTVSRQTTESTVPPPLSHHSFNLSAIPQAPTHYSSTQHLCCALSQAAITSSWILATNLLTGISASALNPSGPNKTETTSYNAFLAQKPSSDFPCHVEKN